MRVSDVMTHNAECTRPDATVQEAAARMKSLNVGSLPVCDNDRLVGMITDRDITVRSVSGGQDPMAEHVRNVMTAQVIYCFEEQDVREAARIMQQEQVRRLPVLNQDKRLVGIVSLGDLAVETGDEQMAGHALEGISEPSRPETQRPQAF
jgi:CBS domain-containing protein